MGEGTTPLGPLDELRALLRSPVGDESYAPFPSQPKMFNCGQHLLKHINQVQTKGFFAVLEVKNISRSYVYGGAPANLMVWAEILKITRECFPGNFYMGRITPGVAIHGWGDNVQSQGMDGLVELEARLASLSFVSPQSGHRIDIHISINVGFLVYPDDCGFLDDFTNVTRFAALASIGFDAYQYRSRMQRFTSALIDESDRNSYIAERVEDAYATDSMAMVYQPRVDIRTGRIVGAEALIRWDEMTMGPIAPNEFIPVLESGRQIVAFTMFTLDKVTKYAAANFAHRTDGFRLSVNISRNFLNWVGDGISPLIADLLERNGCPGRCLEFEITESAYFHKDVADTIKLQLERVKQLGVTVSLDDFGSGYGALRLLAEGVATTIKIDTTTTRSVLSQNSPLHGFLPLLIRTIATSNIQLVVEGVEEEWQHRALLDQGITLAQGYLYSRPLAAADLLDLIARAEDEPLGRPPSHRADDGQQPQSQVGPTDAPAEGTRSSLHHVPPRRHSQR